jgi:glycerol uptake facilitator-like aquaporin
MLKSLLVEFLGTMFIVFVIFNTWNYLAIGAATAIAIILGAKISGGAYNPAIATAFYVSGKIDKSKLLPYIIAETLGALTGFYLFKHVVEK